MLKPIQISASAPIMPSMRVSTSVALSNRRMADSFEAALVALGAHPRPVVARLSVRMPAGTVRLDPGQTAKIELEIVVPRALPERGRYRGTAAILTADLEFIVIVAAAAGVEPAPGAASPTKRSNRRSARKTR